MTRWTQRIRRGALLCAAALAGWTAAPAPVAAQDSRSLAGAYLAARGAAAQQDLAAAARWYAQALALDPGDRRLQEQTLNFKALTGDLRTAASVAQAIAQDNPGHTLASLVLVVDALSTASFEEALELMDGAGGSGLPPVLRPLLVGWANVGQRDAEAAEAAFDAMQGNALFELAGAYHRGLARAAMGDLEGAEQALATVAGPGAASRAALAHALVLEQLGRRDEALAALEELAAGGRADPSALAELERMRAGEEEGVLPVRSARSGAAEALFTIAGMLGQNETRAAALLYSQLALTLRPELHEARLLAGRLFAGQDQNALAEAAFRAIPRGDPLFLAAEIGRAEALRAQERTAEAIIALEALAEARPDSLEAQVALAGVLRGEQRWTEAAEVYTRAVDLVETPERRHWALFYERGIAWERADEWDRAEADFRFALELEPDQPNVLNYLGYSLVELRRSFEEAEQMIRTAVEQRPEDGYITDSLGWVLYRTGQFEEAVPILERAVELTPVDPIINDHLGDALWMVGRKREAEFQWKRALSFDPEEDEAERIRRKLDVGLDAVLRTESQDAVSEDAGAGAAEDDDG